MRRIRVDQVVTLLTVAALAGCAGAPPKVASLGENAYQLSVVGKPATSQADTNYRAVAAATEYCAQMGQQVLFRQSQESGEHTWSPKREDLTFVCMSANDPAYLHAGLKRDTHEAVVAQQ
jgi:hypothetical protein